MKAKTWKDWSSYAKLRNQKANLYLVNWVGITRWRNEANVRRNWKIQTRDERKRKIIKRIARWVIKKGSLHLENGTFNIGSTWISCFRTAH